MGTFCQRCRQRGARPPALGKCTFKGAPSQHKPFLAPSTAGNEEQLCRGRIPAAAALLRAIPRSPQSSPRPPPEAARHPPGPPAGAGTRRVGHSSRPARTCPRPRGSVPAERCILRPSPGSACSPLLPGLCCRSRRRAVAMPSTGGRGPRGSGRALGHGRGCHAPKSARAEGPHVMRGLGASYTNPSQQSPGLSGRLALTRQLRIGLGSYRNLLNFSIPAHNSHQQLLLWQDLSLQLRPAPGTHLTSSCSYPDLLGIPGIPQPPFGKEGKQHCLGLMVPVQELQLQRGKGAEGQEQKLEAGQSKGRTMPPAQHSGLREDQELAWHSRSGDTPPSPCRVSRTGHKGLLWQSRDRHGARDSPGQVSPLHLSWMARAPGRFMTLRTSGWVGFSLQFLPDLLLFQHGFQ